MEASVSEAEIKEAMFSTKGNKASSPDGYTAGFYKKNWIIVGKDVIEAIKFCLRKITWTVEQTTQYLHWCPKLKMSTT